MNFQTRFKAKALRFLFDRIVLDHAGVVIAIAAVVTLLAAVAAPIAGFDYNLLKLQNPTLESVKFEPVTGMAVIAVLLALIGR